MLPNENNHIHYRRSGLVRGRCSVELDFLYSLRVCSLSTSVVRDIVFGGMIR